MRLSRAKPVGQELVLNAALPSSAPRAPGARPRVEQFGKTGVWFEVPEKQAPGMEALGLRKQKLGPGRLNKAVRGYFSLSPLSNASCNNTRTILTRVRVSFLARRSTRLINDSGSRKE